MAEQANPVLQKPPGYRDPTAKSQVVLPSPSARKPVKPVLPVTLPPRKKRRSCFRSCCCYIFLLVLLLTLLTAIAGCCFYIFYEPRLPVFRLESFQFPLFNITNGPDGPALTSKGVVRIELKNPNNVLRVNYGKMKADLNSFSLDLGSAEAPGFTQAKKNTTVLKFTAEVKDLLIGNEAAAKRLKVGVRTKGLVMNTEVRTVVGVGANGWNTLRASVKVVCGEMSLKEVEGGAVPKCHIYVLDWFNIPI